MATLFQKRHYELLADWLHEERWQPETNSFALFEMKVNRLTHWLADDNPRFKRDKFIDRAINGRKRDE